MNLAFDFPAALQIGLPLSALVLAGSAWLQRRRGQAWLRLAILTALRAVAFLVLIFLAARPVWVEKEKPAAANRKVVLMMDRSESMSLEEGSGTRYEQALDFARNQLLPAVKSAGLPVEAALFAESSEPADGDKLVSAAPNGHRTNLGGAIVQALANPAEPPLAVIALTDGIANETADNNRALSALVETGVPFIGVGFGSDLGIQTLSLRHLDAPPVVAPKTAFHISAQLEGVNIGTLPAFDLILFRDEQVMQKKSVQPGTGSRNWQESFEVTEEKEGAHKYEVRLLPPTATGLKCVNSLASTAVRITNEKELRVLYIQGALTWDYKFIGMALRNDPTMKLTGLTRTSKQSIFRQNVESSGELMNGFPTSLEEIAPFRVIVLSNIRPADLTTEQQEILARFCGEMGGGILMIGGAGTFDSSWQGSRLEQLLPVTFASGGGVEGLDRPFRIQLTDDALQHQVFQIAEGHSTRETWSQLPTFTQYGRVDSAKPGAQVWALHPEDEGPRGRRILMASQRYGAGLSAIICIQNFWRWRLAKDSDPQQFDRFWRQLFRYLSEIGRQDITIHLSDQELHPQMDVQVVLERQPNPKNITDTNRRYVARVEDAEKNVLADQTLDLEPSRPRDLKFRAEKAGTYTVTVLDAQKIPVATYPVEIRDINIEFQNTGRDMETLRQWAAVSDGLALKLEDCRGGGDLVKQIKGRVEQAKRERMVRQPAGINGLTLTLLLGCLGGGWLLRRRWGLT